MLSVAAGTQPLHEVLGWGVKTLGDANVDTPRLDAEVLLGAALGVSRAQLLARLHESLGRTERIAYRGLILRRARGEPVAYILGYKEFYGRRFEVDRRVLIPRPETELLVDRALDLLDGRTDPIMADVGTGSGIIAVTLAAERPNLRVIATDESSGALDVARSNAERHDVADRITFLQGSLLDPVDTPVDLVAANLPYVGTEEADLLPSDVVDYEPHEALFAGPDGLDLIRNLLAQVDPSRVQPDGVLLLEIGYGHSAEVVDRARDHFPEARVEVHQDLAGFDRLIEIIL